MLLVCGCDDPTSGSDAGPFMDAAVDADVLQCAADRDCEDDAFCTVSRCVPGDPAADERGCVELGSPCDADQVCDETSRSCTAGCDVPDADGDGHEAVACGGDDCDDDDANRFPGNPEVCDPEGHDEDCVDETWGDVDEDGDGVLSASCCFGDSCGADCDDASSEVFGGAMELCNTLDDDCDGVVDGPTAYCPFGVCVESRCRASAWARAFGGASGAEAVFAANTDREGGIYLLTFSTSDDRFPLGGGTIGPGVSVVSFQPDGRYRWNLGLGEYDPFSSSPVTRANSALALLSDALVRPGASELVVTRTRLLDEETVESDLRWYDTHTGAELRSTSIPTPVDWSRGFLVDARGAASGILVSRLLEAPSGERLLRLERRDWEDGTELAGRDLATATGDTTLTLSGLASAGDELVAIGELEEATEIDGETVGPGFAILRFDADLGLSWARSMPAAIELRGVDLAADGSVLLLGSHSDAVEIPEWGESWPADAATFVAVLDPAGGFEWVLRAAASFAFARFDSRGGIAVGGSFENRLNLGLGWWTAEGGCEDGFAITLDEASGAPLSGRNFPGTGCEAISAMAVDPFGATILGGSFTDRIRIGGSTYSSSFAGRSDAFVVRTAD